MTESIQRTLKLAWLDICERGWYWLAFGVVFTVAATVLLHALYQWMSWYADGRFKQEVWDTGLRLGWLLTMTVPMMMCASAFAPLWRNSGSASYLLLPVNSAERVSALVLSRFVFGFVCGFLIYSIFWILATRTPDWVIYRYFYYAEYQIPITALYFFGSVSFRRFGSAAATALWLAFVYIAYRLVRLSLSSVIIYDNMIPNYACGDEIFTAAAVYGVYGIPGWLFSGIFEGWFYVIIPAVLIYMAYRKLRVTER